MTLGQLPDDTLVEVIEHLQFCPDCETIVEQLDKSTDDCLISSIRRAHLTAEATGQAVETSDSRGCSPWILGDYRIIGELGSGGMGQVYKAIHQTMGRTVALKVMSARTSLLPLAAERFQAEVRASATLTHPNIVIAHDAGECNGISYLVMEWVDGSDLATLVTEAGPLSTEQLLDYGLQAARGIQYAHSHGFVHRDIKPANIMVDRCGVIKILDLGLAHQPALPGNGSSADNGTSTAVRDVVVGSCHYMSPEQARRASELDHRADIYSLSCCLYFMAIGEPPFTGSTVHDVLENHRLGPIPRIRERRHDTPPEFNELVERMLAKNPPDRYGDMSAVVSKLEKCRSRLSSRRPSSWLVMLVGLALLCAVGVYRLSTNTGEVVIEPFDKAVEVLVKRNGLQVESVNTKTSNRISLRSGDYELQLKDGAGWRLSPSQFTLGRGDVTIVAVRRTATFLPPLVSPFDMPTARQYQKNCSLELDIPVAITNSLGMELVVIPAGTLVDPHHRTRMRRPFYIGKHEVTRGEFRQFIQDTGYTTIAEKVGGFVWDHMSSVEYYWKHPGYTQESDKEPVVQIALDDAKAFCMWLSVRENKRYRLPSAEEWTWAARAGSNVNYCYGDDAAVLDQYAWFDGDVTKFRTHRVGLLKPNAWGLHDIHGNVIEWTDTPHGENQLLYGSYYGGDGNGGFGVIGVAPPEYAGWHYGFRVCCDTPTVDVVADLQTAPGNQFGDVPTTESSQGRSLEE